MLFLSIILFFSFCFPENFVASGTNLSTGLKEVRPHSYPFIVTILKKRSNGQKDAICSGTLISKKYVVTAAHCLVNGNNNEVSHSKYKVGVGVHQVRDPDELISIKSIKLHPSYDRRKYENDIALIKLSKAMEFTDIIRPMCLQDMPVDHVFRNGTIAGLSRQPFEIASRVLMDGVVSIWSNSDCNRAYTSPEWNPMISISPNQICVGGNGSRTCFVHSGSPLFATFKEKYYFLGFTLFGMSECPSRKPDVYLRIPPFIDWIKQNSDYSGKQCAVPVISKNTKIPDVPGIQSNTKIPDVPDVQSNKKIPDVPEFELSPE